MLLLVPLSRTPHHHSITRDLVLVVTVDSGQNIQVGGHIGFRQLLFVGETLSCSSPTSRYEYHLHPPIVRGRRRRRLARSVICETSESESEFTALPQSSLRSIDPDENLFHRHPSSQSPNLSLRLLSPSLRSSSSTRTSNCYRLIAPQFREPHTLQSWIPLPLILPPRNRPKPSPLPRLSRFLVVLET